MTPGDDTVPTKTTPPSDSAGQPGQPDAGALLEQITTLVRSLDQVVARTTSGGGTPPSDSDPERVRRQAVARLRYDIVSGLLGRAGFVPPFAPARRGDDNNEIVFQPPLPEETELVILRSTGPNGVTQRVTEFVEGDGTTTIDTGAVGEEPLQPIEIYDGDDNLIRLGPNLAARQSGSGGRGRRRRSR
jgi:hypothetical protein